MNSSEPDDKELIEAAMRTVNSALAETPDSEHTMSGETQPLQPPAATPSPTLEALEKSRRPRAKTVCEGCVNSVWFTSPSEVKCYCRVMFLITWSNREPHQITACDGIWLGQD